MLKLGTVVTVLLVSLGPSRGLRLQQKDVLHLLEFLKAKDDLETRQREVEVRQTNDNSEENNSMDRLIKKMEVIDLIEKADRDGSKSKFGEVKDEYGDYDMFVTNQENDVIEELVHGRPLDLQKKTHHVLIPNNLLGTSEADDRKQDPMDSLNEYSKVYVVLDPVAIQKSKNNDALSNMISKILALSPSIDEMARQNRKERSRFKVKSNHMSRRYKRDSRESYYGDEDNYKPSRSRHDDSGAGTGGGRTGIPYMRPRGDIYEKN